MKHEFVQFHKLANLPTDVEGNDDAGEVEEEEEGIDLSDVIAAAGGGKAVSFPDDIPTPSNKYSKIKSYKDLTSRSLKGSVQRHSMYANWAKFERSVTTLLGMNAFVGILLSEILFSIVFIDVIFEFTRVLFLLFLNNFVCNY